MWLPMSPSAPEPASSFAAATPARTGIEDPVLQVPGADMPDLAELARVDEPLGVGRAGTRR